MIKCIPSASALFIALISSSNFASAGFGYICLQPEDSVYTTVPSIDWSATEDTLKSEYTGNDLFKPITGNKALVAFRPIPNLEIIVSIKDSKQRVVFDRVRFLQAEGKLYTWIGFTATTNTGVVHRVVRSIKVDGKEVAHSRPITINVRADLFNCNS